MTISRQDIKGKFELVALEDLETDGRFNRPVSQAHIDRLANNYDGAAFGTLVLSRRSDGSLVILDGQHRAEVLRQLGLDPTRKIIPAIVHEKLSFADEAYQFWQLNYSKKMTPYEGFKARLAAGDPDICHINTIVEKLGLRVASGVRDGAIVSIATLERLYKLSEPKGSILRQTLHVIINAWGDSKDPLRHQILEGVARYIVQHPEVDRSVLSAKLAGLKGGPSALRVRADSRRGPTPTMSLPFAIALVIEKEIMRRGRQVSRTRAAQ